MNRLLQLELARALFGEEMISPREKGIIIRIETFTWTYHFGFITPEWHSYHFNKTQGGNLKKYAKQGYLIESKTKSGSPKFYYTLSIDGLREVEKHLEILHQYKEIDPLKVNQKNMRHDVIVQLLTSNALKRGLIKSYKTERVYTINASKRLHKQPDVVWEMNDGSLIGVEVELSSKWGRHRDEFITQIKEALSHKKDQPPQFSRFLIFSESNAIINNYKIAMQPDTDTSTWAKDERNHWYSVGSIQLPDWLIERVDFHLFKNAKDELDLFIDESEYSFEDIAKYL